MTTTAQARNFYPAFRVFIFGVEVTDDVLDVSVTHNDARQPSTCSITLISKGADAQGRAVEDRYVVTKGDIQAINPKVDLSAIGGLPAYQKALANARDAQTRIGQAALQTTQALLSPFGALTASTAPAAVSAKDLSDTYGAQNLEAVAAASIRTQIDKNIQTAVQDKVKQTVFKAKTNPALRQVIPIDERVGGPEFIATADQFQALTGKTTPYPYQVGDCIFHSNDSVRVFFRDPQANVDAGGQATWYHMFAGFITDTVDDVDVNNVKTVTVRCEDVLRRLRYARLTTSPGLADLDAVATSIDLSLRTFFNDDFRDLTLAEFLFAMVFGFGATALLDKAGATTEGTRSSTDPRTVTLVSANGGPIQALARADGVGLFSFNRSAIFVFGQSAIASGPPAPGSTTTSLVTSATLAPLQRAMPSLPAYMAFVDHQVRPSDLTSMAVDVTTTTTADPIVVTELAANGQTSIDAVIKAIGEHPEIYPVDGGRLILIAPAQLGVGYQSSVFFQDIKGVELSTSWATRLAKIYDVFERIEFSFWATPRGDLVAEMPFHDFDPKALGTEPLSYDALAKIVGAQAAQNIIAPGQVVPPFFPYYHLTEDDTIRWSKSFNDEKVRTVSTCSYWPLGSAYKEIGTSQQFGVAPSRRVISSLVAQFGARAVPGEPTVHVTTAQAAEIYAQLLLNRFNGEARAIDVEALPQLRLLPNRPMLFAERTCVSTIREITHNIVWGERGDMSMRFKTNYLRGWDGSTDAEGNPLYSYLGGFAANPLNYALLIASYQPKTSAADLSPPVTYYSKILKQTLPVPPGFTKIGDNVIVPDTVAAAFNRMNAAAIAEIGTPLQISSGTRTNEEQKYLFKENHGVQTAEPGTSLHESGVAIDINVGSMRGANNAFINATPNSAVFDWLVTKGNAQRFGFTHPIPGDPPHFEYHPEQTGGNG